MIEINKDVLIGIVSYVKKCLPEESCGMLAGFNTGEHKTVKSVYFVENAEHSNVHYRMALKEQFNALRSMRVKGYVLLGTFHSHPNGRITPSPEDIRLAFDEDLSYVIISIFDGKAEVGSFIIKEGMFEREELVIAG